MRKYLLIWFTLSFGFCLHVGATECERLMAKFIKQDSLTAVHFTILNAQKAQIAKKDFENIQKTIDEINKFANELSIPSELMINLSLFQDNPATYTSLFIINHGLQFIWSNPFNGKVYKKHPKYSQAIIAHEYGHILFNYNHFDLGKIPIKRDDNYEEMRSLKNKINQHYAELDLLIKKTKNVDINSLESLFEEINKKISLIDEIDGKYTYFTAPYEELFADIVSLLLTEDPKGLANSILFTSGLQLSGEVAKNKIHNSSRDFTNKINSPKHLSVHGFFSKVRSHLWKSYLSSPQNMKKKDQIFHTLFKAISKKANDNLLNQPPSIIDEWENLNNELISTIDEELSRIGVMPLK